MEVYALVGPSGTGKSHRAAFVAGEHGVDVIIDDGLIIKGSNILGGVSAKSRSTMLGAVRTALFTDADHAGKAIELLKALQPAKVLILGTSAEMVRKIANRLELPEPMRTITIEDIATEKDIKVARYMRNTYGKHIIPAPTAEVRKSFSGFLLDPVHVLLRLKNRPKPKKAVEKTLVRPTYFRLGKISIADNVIDMLIKKTVRESGVPVKVGKALVKQGEGGVRINLTVQVKYGINIHRLLRQVQELLKNRIEYLTGLQLLTIDIIVSKVDIGE